MRHLIYILIILIFTGCFNEDDASIVAIHVSPSSECISSGEKMYFDISVSTLNNTIEKIDIETFDSQYGPSFISSLSPATKTFRDRIVYEAPAMDSDSTIVEFLFRATDNTQATSELKTYITVLSGGSSLPEISSIVLYSPWSDNNDAFSFTSMQPVKSKDTADSNVDLCFISQSQTETMPLSIGTKTGIVYSRANNLDYSAISESGLQSIFKNSLRQDTINNLAVDDVIIFGREIKHDESLEIKAVGVFKVMAIYDEPGSSSDRIVINLKHPN